MSRLGSSRKFLTLFFHQGQETGQVQGTWNWCGFIRYTVRPNVLDTWISAPKTYCEGGGWGFGMGNGPCYIRKWRKERLWAVAKRWLVSVMVQTQEPVGELRVKKDIGLKGCIHRHCRSESIGELCRLWWKTNEAQGGKARPDITQAALRLQVCPRFRESVRGYLRVPADLPHCRIYCMSQMT